MFKPCVINSYLRVPFEEIYKNLSPEYMAHLRTVFNIKADKMNKIEMEFGACNEIVFHYKDEV